MRGWFSERDFRCHTYHMHRDEQLPTVDDFDWLVIMGGPQSVYQEAEFPWLAAEKALIREAIAAAKKILGVCLGGQLIASALGARVYANTVAEIGWYPIVKTAACATWMESEQHFLSWHNDTFDLPNGATAFAKSDLTACQGFCYGANVWALQFHIEAEPGTAAVFLQAGGGELPSGPCTQAFTELLTETHCEASTLAARALLDLMHRS